MHDDDSHEHTFSFSFLQGGSATSHEEIKMNKETIENHGRDAGQTDVKEVDSAVEHKERRTSPNETKVTEQLENKVNMNEKADTVVETCKESTVAQQHEADVVDGPPEDDGSDDTKGSPNERLSADKIQDVDAARVNISELMTNEQLKEQQRFMLGEDEEEVKIDDDGPCDEEIVEKKGTEGAQR